MLFKIQYFEYVLGKTYQPIQQMVQGGVELVNP